MQWIVGDILKKGGTLLFSHIPTHVRLKMQKTATNDCSDTTLDINHSGGITL